MGLIIHEEKLSRRLCKKLIDLCPFSAIKENGEFISIGAECRLCKLCVGKSEGAISFEEEDKCGIDKSIYRGILVFCEHYHGKIHDVTFELLGKAQELAEATHDSVHAVMIGYGIMEAAQELSLYGADYIYVYDNPVLENFMIEPYSNAFIDCIQKIKPSAVLVGATNVGRSLAPRVAARLKCGLTADCTALEMCENSDLVQIRPAFGGNIMAEILTPETRPQFCTARYKVFSKIKKIKNDDIGITLMDVTPQMLERRTEILSIDEKPAVSDISEADVLVQVGRGVKDKKDLGMIRRFADLIGAQIACTRPLVEASWFDTRHQIGLSGRTVKPKLLVCIGVSGAIQTVAGMRGSDLIIAINNDSEAPIFDVAHYGFVGNLYEIIPDFIKLVTSRR